MMTLIFKALFIYFIFLFFRSVWRGYRMVEELKSRSQEFGQKAGFENFQESPSRSNTAGAKGDVLEAEYRVINKD
ncbi:MAG: hypothetical protein KC493_15265 [Bacteriovoracaceae bacterium]|nr:hypothetical protein [Bacteriovoracaceae bacterium]